MVEKKQLNKLLKNLFNLVNMYILMRNGKKLYNEIYETSEEALIALMKLQEQGYVDVYIAETD